MGTQEASDGGCRGARGGAPERGVEGGLGRHLRIRLRTDWPVPELVVGDHYWLGLRAIGG